MQVEVRGGVVCLLLLWTAGLAAAPGSEVLPPGFLEFLGNMVEIRDVGQPDPASAVDDSAPRQAQPAVDAEGMGELVDPLSLDPEQEREDE